MSEAAMNKSFTLAKMQGEARAHQTVGPLVTPEEIAAKIDVKLQTTVDAIVEQINELIQENKFEVAEGGKAILVTIKAELSSDVISRVVAALKDLGEYKTASGEVKEVTIKVDTQGIPYRTETKKVTVFTIAAEKAPASVDAGGQNLNDNGDDNH
jgi:hypothetical protein